MIKPRNVPRFPSTGTLGEGSAGAVKRFDSDTRIRILGKSHLCFRPGCIRIEGKVRAAIAMI